MSATYKRMLITFLPKKQRAVQKLLSKILAAICLRIQMQHFLNPDLCSD